MPAMQRSASTREMPERIRRRFAYSVASANVAGGLVVFAFIAFVLPIPPDAPHQNRLLLLNSGVAALYMVFAIVIAWNWSARCWERTLGWIASGREPSEPERERALRFPLTQQRIDVVLWAM